MIGGAPRETCEALARDGLVGFSPIRRPTRELDGHLDDVMAAVEYVLRLDFVDRHRLGIMGFSRGGLLTFQAAARRPDFRAVVLMAPAPGGEDDLQQSLSEATKVSAPVLILVAENDVVQANHVQLSRMVRDALGSAGKQVELILFPPFDNDGHLMFFEIGEYWSDVHQFFAEYLAQE